MLNTIGSNRYYFYYNGGPLGPFYDAFPKPTRTRMLGCKNNVLMWAREKNKALCVFHCVEHMTSVLIRMIDL